MLLSSVTSVSPLLALSLLSFSSHWGLWWFCPCYSALIHCSWNNPNHVTHTCSEPSVGLFIDESAQAPQPGIPGLLCSPRTLPLWHGFWFCLTWPIPCRSLQPDPPPCIPPASLTLLYTCPCSFCSVWNAFSLFSFIFCSFINSCVLATMHWVPCLCQTLGYILDPWQWPKQLRFLPLWSIKGRVKEQMNI